MNKKHTFYSSISKASIWKTLLHQGCIKSCILRKKNPRRNRSATRVLFWVVFRKEALC